MVQMVQNPLPPLHVEYQRTVFLWYVSTSFQPQVTLVTHETAMIGKTQKRIGVHEDMLNLHLLLQH